MADLTLCRFCNAKVPRGSVMCEACTERAKDYLGQYGEALSGGAYLIREHHYWAKRYTAALEERGKA